MITLQRLFVIVGSPGSGKDSLIRAVNDLGTQHAQIVPKHTSRQRWEDDRNEMICPGDKEYGFGRCDIVYENYGDKYGIESSKIWTGLRRGVSHVIVVSNIDAINELREFFGELVVLVYVHSEIDADEYRRREAKYAKATGYVEQRVAEYQLAYSVYLDNFLAFDHVLISSNLQEDLFDQMFRLFRAYELNLGHAAVKPPVSDRVWEFMMSSKPSKPMHIIGKG